MTVCIAAICEKGNVVVGLSDRMVTWANVTQYEPKQTKPVLLTNAIFAMAAGVSDTTGEILYEIKEIINMEIEKEWKVIEIAKLCQEILGKIEAREAAAQVLRRYGLDTETFLSRQSELEPNFVKQLSDDISNIEIPAVELIIAGIDLSGSHIFSISKGKLSYKNKIGYAAIGVGAWHAESELIKTRYAKWVSSAVATFVCYMAKKSAEASPGVGNKTDILFVHGNEYHYFPESLVDELDHYYWTMKEAEHNAQISSLNKWHERIEKAGQKNQENEKSAPK